MSGAPLGALYASNGTAPAVRATISSDRLPGDMDIITDSVANWPHTGIATSGTPDPDGVIIPGTECVFIYVLSGTIIHITGFAPGYYDVGHTENQICILKPTTHHTDSLIEAIENLGPSLPVGGTTNQVLAKLSAADGDAGWIPAPGNSSWVFNVTPTGAIDGTNAVFTLSGSASNAIVVLNGLVLKPGIGNDYDLTGTTLTLATPPTAGSNLTVSYTTSTTAMIDGSNSLVFQETPTGAVNGSNLVFTTAKPYIGGTLAVFINGIRQKGITHFTETSPTAGTFTMGDAPLTGDDIMVAYQFAKAVQANADTVDNFHASSVPLANTLMPLDANAKINTSVLSNPYRFSVARAAAWSPTAGVSTKVPFDTVEYDPNGNWNSSTSIYTAPVTGTYFINGQVGVSGTTASTVFVVLQKNTADVRRGNRDGSNNNGYYGLTTDIMLTAGDTISLKLYASAGGIENDVTINYFQGRLVAT